MGVQHEEIQLRIIASGNAAKKELADLGMAQTDLKRKIEGLNKGTKDYTATKRKLETELKSVNERMRKMRSEIDLTSLSQRDLMNRANDLKRVMANMNPNSAQWKKLNGDLQAVTARQRELRGSTQQLRGTWTGMTGSMKSFGASLMGALGPVVGIYAVFTGLKNAVSAGLNFEHQMSKVKAISGATASELEQLSSSAKQLGASTMFTATQVGELQEEFSKLGFSVTEILAATPASLDLAAASGSALSEVALVAGSSLRGFGLDASETQRVTDVMALSFSSSALNLEHFQESMKLVAPIARAANIDIETTTALLGKLADSGLKGSIAGTGLKNIISDLSNENSALAKELGFAVKNSDDLIRAFQQLKEGNIDLTKATALTDERSKAAFLTLINGIDTVDDLKTALEGANGAAKEMADTMMDDGIGSVTKMKSAWEGLTLALEQNGAIRASADAITKLITGWNYLAGGLDENQAIQDALKNIAVDFRDVRMDDLASGYKDMVDIQEEMAERQMKVNEQLKERQAIEAKIRLLNEVGTSVPKQLQEEYDALLQKIDVSKVYVRVLSEITAAKKKDREDEEKAMLAEKTELGIWANELAELRKSEREKERDAVEKQYVKLFEKADQFGVGRKELEEKMRAELAAINAKWDETDLKAFADQQARKAIAQAKADIDSIVGVGEGGTDAERGGETSGEKEAEAKAKMEKEFEDRAYFAEQMHLLERTAEELDIEAANAYYDEMVELADKYRIDTTLIEKKRSEELSAIKKKHQNDVKKAESISLNDGLNQLSGALDQVEGLMGENAENMRGFALMKLAIDTATSISSAIAGATAAAAATGPGAPFALGAYIATMIATVVTSFVKAKKLLSGDTPKHRKGTILEGPSHEQNGMAIIDQHGNKVAEVEGGEGLISKASTKANMPFIQAMLDNPGKTIMPTPQFQVNTESLNQSVNQVTPKFRNGSSNLADDVSGVQRPKYDIDSSAVAAVNELKAMMMEWPTSIKAEVSMRQFSDKTDELNEIKSFSDIRASK